MSTTMILLLLGGVLLLVGVVVAVVIAVRRRPDEASSIEDRLAEYSERDTPVTLEELELSASFADRVIYPTIDALSKFVSQFTPEKVMENIQRKLELAENPGNLTPANFLAIRLVAMFVLGGLIFVLMIIAKLPVSRRILFTVVVTAGLVGVLLDSPLVE